MEVQLQDLIDQIKKDGVEAAEAEAETILKNANEKARRIVSEAEEKARKLMLDAKAENEKTVKFGEEAIRQAGRNLLISFRESVQREVKAVIGEKVGEVYSSEEMSRLIADVVGNWSKAPEAESITVLLNGDDLKKLEENVLADLKKKTLNGITLRPNDNFNGGFRIALNDGGAYYDYSAEAVTDMLSVYLNSKLTELLKEA